MTPYRAAVFDLDDTLYDYESLHREASLDLNRFFCGQTGISQDAFARAFSDARKSVKERLGNTAASHNRLLYFQTALERLGLPPLSLGLEMYDAYWNYFLSRMRPREGAAELLEWLRGRGIRIAVCTDLTVHIQHRKLRALGLDGLIDVLVTSEEAGEEKPGQAIFRLCLEKLGVPASDCFFVGDSVKKDMRGAWEAGITPVLFADGIGKDDGGFPSVHHFSGLREWLERTGGVGLSN